MRHLPLSFLLALTLAAPLPACGTDSDDTAPAGAAGAPASGGSSPTASGGTANAGFGATAGASPVEEQFDHTYDVGPGQEYEDPSQVPWETLGEGTLVRIHSRPDPYPHKWVINTTATAERPLVVRGVPDGDALPVITGQDATTRPDLSYWNENRSVIKVGGSNLPTDQEVPAYVRIENLDIRGARPDYQFTTDDGGTESYAENAAAVHVEIGDHITIKGCILHDAGNGFFSGHQTSNLLLDGNYIYDNGIPDSIYHHNNYTESLGITFQYNHFGPLCAGCLGNNLKDRSAGTVIRYNWIESGNRQLDLVESDYAELVDDPSYDQTFVYGNILVEPDAAGNSQIAHYGGDGDDETMYRRSTLYFYHNTMVSTRSGNTTLLRLSTNDVTADVRNNIIYATAPGGSLALCSGQGNLEVVGNWLSDGYVVTHESAMAGQLNEQGNLTGAEPGFVDAAAQLFSLVAGSPCSGAAGELAPAVLPGYDVTHQYVVHQGGEPLSDADARSIGAFAPE